MEYGSEEYKKALASANQITEGHDKNPCDTASCLRGRALLAADAKLEKAKTRLKKIVERHAHSVSCGEKDNPFNRKEAIDGCNCGTYAQPDVVEARACLKELVE